MPSAALASIRLYPIGYTWGAPIAFRKRLAIIVTMAAEPKRCFWVSLDKPYYVDYHDTEWGVPVHDDQRHFEMLILEGAQAGLSWSIVLNKREGYRRAFSDFNPEKVARYSAARIDTLAADPGSSE